MDQLHMSWIDDATIDLLVLLVVCVIFGTIPWLGEQIGKAVKNYRKERDENEEN